MVLISIASCAHWEYHEQRHLQPQGRHEGTTATVSCSTGSSTLVLWRAQRTTEAHDLHRSFIHRTSAFELSSRHISHAANKPDQSASSQLDAVLQPPHGLHMAIVLMHGGFMALRLHRPRCSLEMPSAVATPTCAAPPPSTAQQAP